MPDGKKLVVVVTANGTGDRSTIAFTVANACLSAGMDVAVFLTSDGVDLAREGACDLTSVRPFRPLAELIDEFSEHGGTLIACGSCFQFRGMDASHTVARLQVAGVATLAAWLADGAQTITF